VNIVATCSRKYGCSKYTLIHAKLLKPLNAIVVVNFSLIGATVYAWIYKNNLVRAEPIPLIAFERYPL
jgi:hypothetical protein